MGVPEFFSFTLPLLRHAGDGKEHSLGDAREALAAEFGLDQAELDELLPSGRQTRFSNRVSWAKCYLIQAGLLLSTARRGCFRISGRGLDVLRSPPPRIDVRFLEQYPEFWASREPGGEDNSEQGDEAQAAETPEEAFESAHQQLTAALASELLARVKSASPQFFERMVVELLLKMGYGGSRTDAGRTLGRSHDEGIDGVISEDRLGLDLVYLQAKKWEGTVGRPEIQKFVGALQGKRAKKGVFITTGTFSGDGVAYAEAVETRVVLVDGQRLAQLMIDFEVGASTARSYHVKRVDTDYFEEA